MAGYETYGNEALSPITLSLSAGWGRWLCQVVVTLHVILACPILLTTFSLDMERLLGFDMEQDPFKQRLALRAVIMSGVVTVALLIPYFADFMTLIGAVANTLLIFVFPIVFDAKLNGLGPWRLCLVHGFILLIGLVGGSLGCYQALLALYHDFQSQSL